jgi:hypothetical protein
MTSSTVPTFSLFRNELVVVFDGKVTHLRSGNKLFEQAMSLLKEKAYDKLKALLKSGEVKVIDKTKVLVKNQEMPMELSDQIMMFRASGLDYDPLLKFWDRLKKNPSERSRQQLFMFLKHNMHPITADGKFVAYRKVREDFMDIHSGTYHNLPGKTIRMDRANVDDNPEQTCSRGLHVATLSYAKDFSSTGRLLLVEVDPIDVVCVPIDYNGTKMRVCAFKVLTELKDDLTPVSQQKVLDMGSEEVPGEEEDLYGTPDQDQPDEVAVVKKKRKTRSDKGKKRKRKVETKKTKTPQKRTSKRAPAKAPKKRGKGKKRQGTRRRR